MVYDIGVETSSTDLAAPIDLRRRMWPATLVGCAIFCGLSIGYDAWGLRAAGDAIPWPSLVGGNALDWCLYLVFVFPIARLTARLPVGGARWPLCLAAHVGADSLLAVVKMALFFAIAELGGSVGLRIGDVVAADFGRDIVGLAALTYLAHRASAAARRPVAPRVNSGHFMVRDADGFRLVRAAEILWADAQGNYVRLHTATGRHLIRSTMAALEAALDPLKFVRIHRRTIVNTDHVARVNRRDHGRFTLRLLDGSELRASRSYSNRVSRLLA